LPVGNPTVHYAVFHSTKPGDNKTVPALGGADSKSGTVPEFNFSSAMKNAGITWDDANLDKFLGNRPAAFSEE
jgi:cytochrome c